MDITIIIVSYNVKEYIISCIDSIYKHSKSKIEFEIIVVDNNSKDGTFDALREKFPKINLIKNENNIGFSKACNQGAEQAKGKFLFFLNPDTLFIEDSISMLYFESKKIERFGVLGPMIISETGEKQQSYWLRPSLFSTIIDIFQLNFLNRKKDYKNKKIEKTTAVDTISGCAFFVSKILFSQLKGFNNNLFWMEDIDFCVRSKKANYDVLFTPITKIIHYVGKSAEKNYKIAISNQLLSKIKYFRIHHQFLSAFLITFCVLIASIIKSVLLALFTPFSKVYRSKISGYLNTIKLILF